MCASVVIMSLVAFWMLSRRRRCKLKHHPPNAPAIGFVFGQLLSDEAHCLSVIPKLAGGASFAHVLCSLRLSG